MKAAAAARPSNDNQREASASQLEVFVFFVAVGFPPEYAGSRAREIVETEGEEVTA